MNEGETGGQADLDRGIDGVVDLDGGLLRRLCVCLHRRCRRRVQDARVMKEGMSDAPTRELPQMGVGLGWSG